MHRWKDLLARAEASWRASAGTSIAICRRTSSERVRDNYHRFKKLTPEQRQRLRERWQNATPEERQRMLERRRQRKERQGRPPPQ